jgi:hypothetical protein
LMLVKVKAAAGLILPYGMSRCLVRGFFESISLSKYRLNAIAELRANTIQSTIITNFNQSN